MPALAARLAAVAGLVASLAAAQGSVVLYPLTADAADTSGNGRHGTVNGGVAFSSDGALFSPGSSISIPPVYAPALSLRASFMLRSDLPLGAGGWTSLFGRQGGGFFHALIYPTTGALGFYHASRGNFFGSSFVPVFDAWHNLTAVFNRDGPGSVAMHVNRQWVYRGGGGFDTAVYPLSIIGNHGIVDEYARGRIRHVSIYPYALSDAEISAWNSPSATPTPSSTASLTPSPTPTPTPFCPPARFQRLAAHGLAGELLSIAPSTANEQDCASSCCLEHACQGYSYTPATPPLVCALYANVTGVVPNIIVVSGVQHAALAAQASGGDAL